MMLTLATAFSLTGLYWVYVLLVRPQLPIPAERSIPRLQQSNGGSQQSAEAVQIAEEYLKDAPWAARAPFKVRMLSTDTFIYADEWKPNQEQGKNDEIHISPFAMVMRRPDAKGKQSWMTLISDRAVLQFSGSLTGKSQVRIIRAALEEDTQIRGSDGLYLAGRYFYFEEAAQTLFSDSPVEFAIGNNRGKAGRVQLDLIPNEVAPSDRPDVWGIRTMRMSKNVAMDLQLIQNRKPFPLSIKCAGGCEYDVASKTATYDKAVRVFRKQGTEVDCMDCDKLTVWFAAKDPAVETKPDGGEKNYQQLETDLKFARLKAEGRPVKLQSDHSQFKAELSTLVFDDANRVLSLTDEKNVHATQKNNTLTVPAITVLISEEGKPDKIVCRGPGKLLAHSPDGEDAFTAEWKKQLTKSTDPANGWDQIHLEQEASVLQPDEGFALGADQIRMWLTPMEFADPFGDSTGGKSEEMPLPDPQMFIAQDNVAIVSPRVEGECQRLQIKFDAPRGKAGPLALARETTQPAIQPAGFSSPGPVVAPTAPQSAPKESEAPRIEEPFQIRAHEIRLRVAKLEQGSNEPPHVAEIHSKGHVQVTQFAEPGKAPTTLQGQRIHVTNEGGNQQVLHVFGDPAQKTPARIEDEQIHLEGPALHLDRSRNRAWVDGAGLFRLPVDRDFSGKSLEVPMKLDIWWDKKMEFDGQLAEFHGNVRAVLDRTEMTCQKMGVALDQKISFSDVNPADVNQAEPASIHCQEGVTFENTVYDPSGIMLEKAKASLWELKVDLATNATTAQGPGWVQRWSREAPSAGGGSQETGRIRANRPLRTEAATWNYLRVDFNNRMTGNLAERTSGFRDGVRAMYGPVPRLMDVLDEDHLPNSAGWLRCRELDIEYLTPPKTVRPADNENSGYLTLVGRGNVDVEGQGFTAKADTVTFDQSKDRYDLKAQGRGTVAIQQNAGRVARAHGYVVIPSKSQFIAYGVTGGQGGGE